jgi:hypothetical protein
MIIKTKSKETTHHKYMMMMMMIFILGDMKRRIVSHFQIIIHFTKLTYLPLPSWSNLKMELAFTSKTSAALHHCPMSTNSSIAGTELTSVIYFHEALNS